MGDRLGALAKESSSLNTECPHALVSIPRADNQERYLST